MAHYIKIMTWLDGVLQGQTRPMNTLEDALAHIEEHKDRFKHYRSQVKVYNEDGELVHVHQEQPQDTYA